MPGQLTADKAIPTVLIVGAGLGGLLLGTLLERANIPYHIYERATKIRPLGSAMTLGPCILSVFEQLGLYEDLKAISLPCPALDTYNDKIKPMGSISLRSHEAISGFQHLIFARPDLHKLLQKQVPPSKISMGKEVLRTDEKHEKVFIHCSDNTSYEGDILVGADGAFSSVRESLHSQLGEKGLLPKEDLENSSIGYINMFGIAKPEDPDKYPQMKDDFTNYSSVLGVAGRSWVVMNLPGGQICWGFALQLLTKAKDQQFNNPEWGPVANEALIKEIQDLRCPWGGTMGDIIHITPKDLISRVYLDEKVFKTWYHGRTVLLGDAAHKMTPAAALGAINAMQDAVVLANCIFNMEDTSPKSTESAFEEYYRQRYSRCVAQCELSGNMAIIMGGHTIAERAMRYALYNLVPEWVLQREFVKGFAYRPQIAWLPLAENRGTMPLLPQEGEGSTNIVEAL